MKLEDPKELVLLYCATGQPALRARLQGSIAAQRRLDRETDVPCPYRKVLVTDAAPDSLPDRISEFFDDVVDSVAAFVDDGYVGKRYFSLSAMRNAALDYALRHGFEWALLCDADTIFADYQVELPDSGFGTPDVYWQRDASEDVLTSWQRVRNPGENTFSNGNSWFLIAERIFKDVRFNENIYGYGFEDNEYEVRTRARGAVLKPAKLRIIHRFHPEKAKAIDKYSWKRNSAIYEYVAEELKAGREPDLRQRVDALPARHRDWEGVLLLFPETRRLLHWPQRQEGSYEFATGRLQVTWDKFGNDCFAADGGVFVSDTLRPLGDMSVPTPPVVSARPADPIVEPIQRLVYLHIGTEKTGTTAIQAAGNGERRRLQQQNGIWYAKLPGTTWHYKLALYATGDKELRKYAGLQDEKAWLSFQQTFPQKLHAEIEDSGCQKIVLSSEHLSSRIRRPAEVTRLAEILNPLGSVKVVCYLRPQHELYSSANSTFVKSGGTFYRPPPRNDNNPFYNYEKMLDPWAAVFGKENVIVRIYDPVLLKNGDVVADFFDLLGYDDYTTEAEQTRTNISFDQKTLRFLMLMNKHIPTFKEDRLNPERADLVKALRGVATAAKPLLPAAELRRIYALFDASNATVAKRFLGRADGVLFPNVRFAEGGGAAELTAEDAVAIAAHLWRWQATRQSARSSPASAAASATGAKPPKRAAAARRTGAPAAAET